MNIKRFKSLICTTTMLGLGLASPALAAEEGASSTEADAPADTESGFGDIVVTAQRREELQRDVPISITTLNEEALAKAGVTNTTELAKVTPGVILPLYGAFILPSIRGISSSGAGIGDSPNVAVYVDGVYQASQSAQLADLPDVQSIQVLKGPQGSLYGQNAAGGAIIIDTIAPSFDLGGKLAVGYGKYNDKTANGYVTSPLTGTVAAMVSGAYRDRDGLNWDLLRGGHDDGLRSWSTRGKILWEPNDAISFTLGGFYTKRNDTGVYSNAPINGNSIGNSIALLPCEFGGLACLNLPIASKPHTFAMNPVADTRIETYGTSLRGSFYIENVGTISTVSAIDWNDVVNFSDVDGTPVNTVDFFLEIKGRNIIQELNFTSEKFGGLTISAGLFYLNKVERYVPQMNHLYGSNAAGLFNTAYPSLTPIFQFGTFSRSEKDSYAGYLEAEYDITDQLTLTAAGRYSYEKARAFNIALPFDWQPGDAPTAPLPDPRGAFTFKKFTPRAVLRFKPNNDNTFYASYSRGFKSGYINTNNINLCTPSPECIDPPVKPETVDAYEVGYKGKITSTLDVSLAAFHYLYKDIQVFIFNPGPPASSRYENAASGKIDGVEFSLAWQAVRDLTFNFGGSYLDAKYKKFPAATVYTPNGFGNTQSAQDVSGNRLMRTPEWTLNGSVNLSHETEDGGFGIYVGASYNSGVYFDPNNRVHQDGYALVDAEFSFSPAWAPGTRLVLWGKNLTDKAYLQSVLESQLADSGTYADPRTYGVRLEYRF